MYLLYTIPSISITPETHPRFKVEADWDGDGSFANAYSDLTADVISDVRSERGNDLETSLTRGIMAGSFGCTLRNTNGKYSTFKTTSPIYGEELPGRLIRGWVLTPYTHVLWTGKLDSIEPQAENEGNAGEPIAILRASGVFRHDLGDQASKVTVGPFDGVDPGDVIEAVLDGAGVPAARRTIAAGTVPVANWWKEEGDAMAAIQEIAIEHEYGNYYEGLDFDHIFEGRYDRVSRTSQATFSATPAAATPPSGLRQEDSLRLVFNRAVNTVHPYAAAPAAATVLWEASEDEPHYLAPGEAVTFIAQYTDGYVETWTTPSVGTDVISATGTPVVSNVTKRAQSMTFTVTNSHGSEAADLTTRQARGLARVEQDEFKQIAEDTTSQGKFGIRTLLGSPYYANADYAKDSAAFVVLVSKDPHPVLELTIPSSASAAYSQLGASLDIGDRVTVEADDLLSQLGIDDEDFFIERIRHSFGPAMPWLTTYTLSPAFEELYGLALWQVGVAGHSELGDTTVVAY
jgi:hypothetical protein